MGALLSVSQGMICILYVSLNFDESSFSPSKFNGLRNDRATFRDVLSLAG